MNADYLTHSHHDIDLEALYFLLFQHGDDSLTSLSWQRHNWNGIEYYRKRIESICESIMEQEMLRLIFTEIYGRVIGLIGVQNAVDFPCETGLQLLMHELHHSQ